MVSPWLAARRHHRAAVNFCGTRIHNGTSSQNASAIPCRHNRAASMHWQSGGTPCCLTVQVDAPASKTEWGVAVPPLLRKAVFASVGTGGCFGRVDWVVGPRHADSHFTNSPFICVLFCISLFLRNYTHTLPIGVHTLPGAGDLSGRIKHVAHTK